MPPSTERVVIVGSLASRYNADPRAYARNMAKVLRDQGYHTDVAWLPALSSRFTPGQADALRGPMHALVVIPVDTKFWGNGLVALAARQAEHVFVADTHAAGAAEVAARLQAWGIDAAGPLTPQRITQHLAPVGDLSAHQPATPAPGWRPGRAPWPQDEGLPGGMPQNVGERGGDYVEAILLGQRGRHDGAIAHGRAARPLTPGLVRVLLDDPEGLAARFEEVVTHTLALVERPVGEGFRGYDLASTLTGSGPLANLIAIGQWIARSAPAALWESQSPGLARYFQVATRLVAPAGDLRGNLEGLASDEFLNRSDGPRALRLYLAGVLVACATRARTRPPVAPVQQHLEEVTAWMDDTRARRVSRVEQAARGQLLLANPLNLATFRYGRSPWSRELSDPIVPGRVPAWGPTMAAVIAGDIAPPGVMTNDELLCRWRDMPVTAEGLGLLCVHEGGWARALTRLWALWGEPKSIQDPTMEAIFQMTASYPPETAEDGALWEALLPRVPGKRALRALLSGMTAWPIIPSCMHGVIADAVERAAPLEPFAIAKITVVLSTSTEESRATRLALSQQWAGRELPHWRSHHKLDLLPAERAVAAERPERRVRR